MVMKVRRKMKSHKDTGAIVLRNFPILIKFSRSFSKRQTKRCQMMKFKYFDQSQRSDFRATLRWPISAKRRRRNSADQLSIKRQYCSTINQYQIPHIWRKLFIKLKEKVNPIDSGNYSPLLIFCVKLWKRLSLPINCNFLTPF